MVWLCETKVWWKAKLCYIDIDSVIVFIEADGIYEDIAKDVETRFDTSN